MNTHPPVTSMFRTPEGEARYFAAYEETMKLWPVEVQEIDLPTNFGTTHIHACGPKDAPSLVLIHGQAISSTMWYPNVSALSEQFRVYVPDILGDMGKSIQTRPFKQPADFGEWMQELFDGLHLKRAHVAGLSYGGFIAAQTALSLPERVNKLILMAPASLLSIRLIFFVRMMGVLIPGLSFETKQKLIMGTAPTNAVPAIQQMFTTNDFRYSMYLPPTFKDDQLRQIKAPTLLIMGDQEVIYNYRKAIARAKKLLPNLQTALIPGAGHALNFDQPALVNQQILDFLK